ncbi:C-type lectin domain family 4 member M-like isoform X1 [Cheilinus undulatus]|uniref:C-type lectin domain family 4 member M-like isoform X1 n=2 Tax=Cheilinus undulatus TaxID=241271 RepID=UPI001BD6126A|nr:C-type lectin domain family 4 member M-like isoform X1 [Cheilinus undulatus]
MKMDTMEFDDYSNIAYQGGKKQPSRCVALCLGLLCALLLTTNILQIIYITQACHPMSADPTQVNYEQDQLDRGCESRLGNLSTGKEALKKLGEIQTQYFNLTSKNRELVQQVRELVEIIDKEKNKLCPSGWKRFGTGCYSVLSVKKNWTSSRRDCLNQGADLTIINSSQEQMFVNTLLQTGVNAWIGLTDSLTEGTWTWVDGSLVTVSYWQEGQPNSHEGEQDCGEIVQSGEVGGWNDDGCFAENVGICEK